MRKPYTLSIGKNVTFESVLTDIRVRKEAISIGKIRIVIGYDTWASGELSLSSFLT